MAKFFGVFLWLVGSLSAIWTTLVIALIARTPADCSVCALVVRGHVGDGGGSWAMWLAGATALNWIIMTLLDIVFVYLVASSIYQRHVCMPQFNMATAVPKPESTGRQRA